MTETWQPLGQITQTVVQKLQDHRNRSWTPDREARLVNLHFQGLSMAEVARELGGITRNAVIGKLHRMGINSAESHDMWTDQEMATLRRCWAAGMSIAATEDEIKKTCGTVRSGNSIACKADRLRLKKRMDQKREFKHKPRVDMTALVLTPEALPVEFKPLDVPFMRLKPIHCREITGQGPDGLACYCGHVVAEGSYCATHHRINHYRVTPAARKW